MQRLFIIMALGLILNGCEAITNGVKSAFNLKPAKVWVEKINLKASDDLNDNSPVVVHVVIAYTPDLLKDLLKLDADTYFQKAQQIKDDNGENIDVFVKEVLPGRRVDMAIKPSKVTGEGAILFARYSSKGDHRVNIGADYEVIIEMGKNSFKAIPVKQ